jgi:hypothetical protein
LLPLPPSWTWAVPLESRQVNVHALADCAKRMAAKAVAMLIFIVVIWLWSFEGLLKCQSLRSLLFCWWRNAQALGEKTSGEDLLD